jgi:hypothetical protein
MLNRRLLQSFAEMCADTVTGPIVRINPWELHVNDPDFCDELYTGASRRRDNVAYHAGQFGNGDSAFVTVPHELHRIR